MITLAAEETAPAYVVLETCECGATSKVFVARQPATLGDDLVQGHTFTGHVVQSYTDIVTTPIANWGAHRAECARSRRLGTSRRGDSVFHS